MNDRFKHNNSRVVTVEKRPGPIEAVFTVTADPFPKDPGSVTQATWCSRRPLPGAPGGIYRGG